MNDFLTYIQSFGSLVLCRMPYLGRIDGVGLDSYERATTIGGSPAWRNNNGFGFEPRTDGRIVVVDSGVAPELRVTSGTIICFSPKFDSTPITIQAILSKSDAGGTAYIMFFGNSANRVTLYNGAVSSLLINAALNGACSITAS